jgi:hypothetical protein
VELAALIAVCVLAAWTFRPGSTESTGMNLTAYQNPVNRLEVAFPPSWHRAQFPMFARSINPRSILALSTFPIPRGSGRGECGMVPSQVREGVGRTGAAVLVSELYVEQPGFGPKLMRQFPRRPVHFRLEAKHELKAPGASREWLFQFTDRGRLLIAAAVLGRDSSAGLRIDVVRILDGLRFGPVRVGRTT